MPEGMSAEKPEKCGDIINFPRELALFRALSLKDNGAIYHVEGV